MNQRQMKKREKRQHNTYWDQFEQLLQTEEVLVQAERGDYLQSQEMGECAVLNFQVESLTNWQLMAVLEEAKGLTLYAYPLDWMAEFQAETCLFKWEGSAEAFQLIDWLKWVKLLKQSPMKAFVQAITGKKRLSEKQAEEWWQQYEVKETEAMGQDRTVLFELKDYVRTLPYQVREVLEVVLAEPVQIRTEKHWRTIPVYQLPVQVVFKEGVSAEKKEVLMNQFQSELRDEIYQSRSYEIELIEKANQ